MSDMAISRQLGAFQVQHLPYRLSAMKSVLCWTMRQSNKSPKTISRLIDRLEAAREELLTIQRSFEELEAVSESLSGPGKIVSRRKLILPVPKDLSR
jgi:hypothetical protein